MQSLSLIDTVYLAAMMDAEGTICITRHRKHAHHNWSYGFFCTITNTYKPLLEWIRGVTGIGDIRPKPRSPGWKACWVWELTVDEAEEFLTIVRPYMRVRHEQADLMIEFIEGLRYTGPHRPLTESEIIKKNVIFDELAQLNKRGA